MDSLVRIEEDSSHSSGC